MRNVGSKIYSGLTLLFLGMIALELLIIIVLWAGKDYPSGNIAVLKIHGPIESSLETVEALKKFKEDQKIKAIVVRIDSPGGAVGASQEIYDQILDVKKTKPVIASMGNVAASGGYYIAAACDEIVAAPGSITGSIGVITQFFMVDDLLKKFNFKWEVIKSGKNKDMGSPLKDLEPEQRKLLQAMIDDVHLQFMEAVSTGRNIELEQIKTIADGRILTGRQAKELLLVDHLGGVEKAVELAVAKTNMKEKVDLFYYPREKTSFFETISGQKVKMPQWFSVQYLLQ